MVKVPLRYRIPWKKIVLYVLAVAFALYLVLPFYWIVAMSFMHEVDAISVPPHWIPVHPTLENYLGFVHPSEAQQLVGGRAIDETPYSLRNSLIVATSTAILNLVLDTFAGSGATGEAAMLEGFDSILIEREDTEEHPYMKMILQRILRQSA